MERVNGVLARWPVERVLAVLMAMGVLLSPVLIATPAQAVGTAKLVDDDGGTAMFDGSTRFVPGAQTSACLTVGVVGASSTDVITLAATDVSGPLAPLLDLEIEVGTGGSHASCTGFIGTSFYTGTLSELAAATGDGVTTGWSPSESPERTFRITAQLSPVAQPDDQAQATFEWRLSDNGVTPPPPPPTSTPTERPTTSPGPTTSPRPTSTTPAAAAGSSRSTAPETSEPEVTPTATEAPTSPDAGTAPPPNVRVDNGFMRRVIATVKAAVRSPMALFAPFLAFALFLYLQNRIDRKDPKLANAHRTQRDLELEFPQWA